MLVIVWVKHMCLQGRVQGDGVPGVQEAGSQRFGSSKCARFWRERGQGQRLWPDQSGLKGFRQRQTAGQMDGPRSTGQGQFKELFLIVLRLRPQHPTLTFC